MTALSNKEKFPMNYLGIDIGTTGVKAVVFGHDGKLVSSAYEEYPVLMPKPGWAELDSAKVIEKCFCAIREAARKVPGKVAAIGVSSQGEAFTPVDKDGRMLCNGMVSFDTRAAASLDKWSDRFGKGKLYRITGHTAHPMFTIFKMLWLRENCKNIFKRTSKFLCFEDLLQYKLGVEDPAMGWPLAGRTMLFDVEKHRWNPDILEFCGISSDRLARPLPSGSIAGKIPGKMCRALNLAEGAAIVTGGHDQPCGALGAGVIKDGEAMYATGTVECICPAFSSLIRSSYLYRSNLCTYNYTMPDLYTTVAFSLTGGNILKWFRDEFGQMEKAEAAKSKADPYELLLKKMCPEPTGLLVLPHFTPTGTPYFDSDAEGAVIGLKLSTRRGEFMRALLEGVALEMRLNLDILDKAGLLIKELIAIGGGAKSRVWTQLKADVIGKPIRTVQITEAGCLGAAMLAASAQSGEKLPDLVKRWVRKGETVRPRNDFTACYSKKFEAYKKLYPAIKKLR